MVKKKMQGFDSTFLEIGSIYHSPRIKQLGFTVFRMYSADFLIFRRISLTRQFLVSLTSIVYFFPTMEVNETRSFIIYKIATAPKTHPQSYFIVKIGPKVCIGAFFFNLHVYQICWRSLEPSGRLKMSEPSTSSTSSSLELLRP